MIFNLQVPILGFDDIKQVELTKIDDIFMKMQSTEDANISFTLINPFVLTEYDFEIPDNVQKLLEVDEKSNLLIMNIVILQNPPQESIVNFVAPIVFNTDNKKAAQIVIDEATTYGLAEKVSTFLNK